MLISEHPRFGEMEVLLEQIRERCAKLAEARLAASTAKGWFDITTWGAAVSGNQTGRRESAEAGASVVTISAS